MLRGFCEQYEEIKQNIYIFIMNRKKRQMLEENQTSNLARSLFSRSASSRSLALAASFSLQMRDLLKMTRAAAFYVQKIALRHLFSHVSLKGKPELLGVLPLPI